MTIKPPAGPGTGCTQLMRGPAKTPSESFAGILQKSIEKINSTCQGHEPLPQSVFPLAVLHTTGTPELALKKSENLLELLERYDALLNDPGVPLKDIYPTISAMEESCDEIAPLLTSLEDTHPLRPIVNELLVIASIETIKFNRGDYC
ncbi:MAG: hypothetical protein JW884_05500 [Deltaproteobacteria bacterium]|nr:hypothetical protein [Deltaproteobacteria bacterium]